jgi:hypothetical protein
LPSITAIARSAIFHGNAHVYDLKNPGRTDESAAFARFFSDKSTHYFTEDDAIDTNSLMGYDYQSCILFLTSYATLQFSPLSMKAKFYTLKPSSSIWNNQA